MWRVWIANQIYPTLPLPPPTPDPHGSNLFIITFTALECMKRYLETIYGESRSYQHTLFPVLKFGIYGPCMSVKEIHLKFLFLK